MAPRECLSCSSTGRPKLGASASRMLRGTQVRNTLRRITSYNVCYTKLLRIEHFDRKVFRTCVPRNIRLAEAPSFGRPVLLHDRASRGAIAYLALAGEILRREDERMAKAG